MNNFLIKETYINRFENDIPVIVEVSHLLDIKNLAVQFTEFNKTLPA